VATTPAAAVTTTPGLFPKNFDTCGACGKGQVPTARRQIQLKRNRHWIGCQNGLEVGEYPNPVGIP
jgi:hypothetical protein